MLFTSSFVDDMALAVFFPVLVYIANYYLNIPHLGDIRSYHCFGLYKRCKKRYFIYSTVSLLVVSLTVTLWVRGFSWEFFFIAFLSVFFALFITFSSLKVLYTKIKYPIAVLGLFPTVWYMNEWVCSMIPGGNIWFDSGVVQPMLFPLTWMIGEKGMTFLIMLVNSLIAAYIILREKKYLSVVVIISTILLLCFFHSDTAIPNGKKIKVALIQGNVHAAWEWRIKNPDKIFNIYKKLSLEAAKSGPDLIVWPEYAIPEDIITNKDLYSDISDLAKQTGAYIVFGSLEKTERTDSRYHFIRDIALCLCQERRSSGNLCLGFTLSISGEYCTGSLIILSSLLK